MTSQTDKEISEVSPTDAMAEAGRKIFAVQLAKMKQHQEGSRTGEDIESVHQMRVATRRMRSLFKLLGTYYKPKAVTRYSRGLRDIARALGRIRDLDVLIIDLREFQSTQSANKKPIMDSIIQTFDKQRRKNRTKLNAYFDSYAYAKFLRKFSKFTRKAGKSALPINETVKPHQVRHLLPIILHERLAAVRAYETVLAEADDEILHALRVEFKQLRYAVEFFRPVLGASAEHFINEVKAMQDLLGRMNDITVFTEWMEKVKRPSDEQQAMINQYIDTRQNELGELRSHFDNQWQSFNRRTVQKQIADALLILR